MTTTETPITPRRHRHLKRVIVGGAAAAVVAGSVFALAPRDTPIVDQGPSTIRTAEVAGVGEVLVDGDGHTLYLFDPDEALDVTCTGGCAQKWPPLMATGAPSAAVGAGVDADLVSEVADQTGAPVLTYAGWPLYRYVSDQTGESTGNGKDQNGGKWWALTPAGERVPS